MPEGDVQQLAAAEEEANNKQQQDGEESTAQDPGACVGGLLGLHGDMFRAIWAALDKRSRQALRSTCKQMRDSASQLMFSLALEQRKDYVQRVAKYADIGCLLDLQLTSGGNTAFQFIGGVWKSKQAQAVLKGLRTLKLLDVRHDSRHVCEAVPALCPGLQALSMSGIYNPLCAQELSSLTALRSLELEGAAMNKQAALAQVAEALTALTHLRLEGDWWTEDAKALDVTPLAKLSDLHTLGLAHMRLAGLKPLAQSCTGITQLGLRRCTFPSAHLLSFPGLQSLTLDECSDDPHQQVLDAAQLTGLTHLSFTPHFVGPMGSRKLDMGPLSALTGLRELGLELSVRGGDGPGLDAALRSCTQLTRLVLNCHKERELSTESLLGLRSMQALSLGLNKPWDQMQAAISHIAALTTLTHLSLDKTYRQKGNVLRYAHIGDAYSAESNRATPSLDLSPLSRLVRLRELQLDCEEEWVCGLPALGVACPQLAQVHIECKGLATAVAGAAAAEAIADGAAGPAAEAPEAAAAAGQGSNTHGEAGARSCGAEGQASSSGADASSSGADASSSTSSIGTGTGTCLPNWRSLESLTFKILHEFHAWHEPAAVAALHLHRAPYLISLKGLCQFTLERGGPESSPEALRAACESLAPIYSRTDVPVEKLGLSRSAHNGPLAAYLSALQPLGPYVKEMYLRNPEEPKQGEKEALAAALPHLLPDHRPFWKPAHYYNDSFYA